jgi:hypothetical protein
MNPDHEPAASILVVDDDSLNHYRLKPVGLQKGRLEVAFFKLCMFRMRFKHA